MSNHWRESTLGAELELAYGKSLPEHARVAGNVPVFGSNGIVGSHATSCVVGPGIIVGRKGSVGEVHYSADDFWPIDTTYFVRNSGDHHWRYLYHLLKHCGLTSLNSHSAVPGLSREAAYAVPIRIPARDEQATIAHVLDQVEHAVNVEESLYRTTRELQQAAMNALFSRGLHHCEGKESEIGVIPSSWEIIPLGSVGRIGNGSTPKRTERRYWDGGAHPWLTSGKIHEGFITHADQFVTDVAIRECHLPVVPAGSVLVAITGQGKTLGNAAITTIATTISQHLAYCTVERPDVDAHFLRFYLASRYDYLRGLGQAGGSTKGALTCAGLRMVPVPRPPIEEQSEIASILGSLEKKLMHHGRRRALLGELFETVLDDLMTGRRTVAQVQHESAAAMA